MSIETWARAAADRRWLCPAPSREPELSKSARVHLVDHLGWVFGAWNIDGQFDKYAHDLLLAADALLLGRETYEGFVQSWSTRTGVYAERINSLPKFVASKKLSAPLEWNATLIQGDVGEEVARLKDQPGESILKFGTGELDHTLIAQNLVDEFHFWMHPVAVGGGQRIFDGFDTRI